MFRIILSWLLSDACLKIGNKQPERDSYLCLARSMLHCNLQMRSTNFIQVQVWAIGPRQELAPPPSFWIQHPARNNASRCVCQKGTGLCFVLGGSRSGHSRFPPFRRWSQPGASSLDETPDLPMPAGDPLAAQRSKPRRSPLRHVEADQLAGTNFIRIALMPSSSSCHVCNKGISICNYSSDMWCRVNVFRNQICISFKYTLSRLGIR